MWYGWTKILQRLLAGGLAAVPQQLGEFALRVLRALVATQEAVQPTADIVDDIVRSASASISNDCPRG